jgi:hypothetical protein
LKLIWKFVLPNVGQNTVEMPAKSKLLHVAYQDGIPTLWAEVDPMEIKVWRQLYVAPTGGYFDPLDKLVYVGTCVDLSFPLVWHVYDGGDGS